MESDNTLIQKLRGLLPEKTAPFLVTDLGNQLELMIDGVEDGEQKQQENPFKGLSVEDILTARIEDKFYTRENAQFELTELGRYLTDPSASIFIVKEMSHGALLSYYEAHRRVISKVLGQDSKYKPIYRGVEIVFGRDIGNRTFYCLMGAAVPKQPADQAAT